MAVDGAGNVIIADTDNNRVRRVSPWTGPGGVRSISTVADNGLRSYSGDYGPATAAQLAGPTAMAVDGAGNVFIADSWNNRIRRLDAATRTITTFAGTGTQGSSGDGGPATTAQLNRPSGVAVDVGGNLYIADIPKPSDPSGGCGDEGDLEFRRYGYRRVRWGWR